MAYLKDPPVKDNIFNVDTDDRGYLEKMLRKKKIGFQTNDLLLPTIIFTVFRTDSHQAIDNCNTLLRRHYKNGKNGFPFWKSKKIFQNGGIKIRLKFNHPYYGYGAIPIFLSMKTLDQSNVLFDIRKNHQSFFGFDIYIDEKDLETELSLIHNGTKYNLSFITD